MAYLTTLFTTSPFKLQAFRQDPARSLDVTRSVECAHLIADFHPGPWDGLLKEAIDGGQVVHPALGDAVHGPRFHDKAAVARLYPQLSAAWETSVSQSLLDEDDLCGAQIAEIVALFHWAFEHDEVIVSFMGSYVE